MRLTIDQTETPAIYGLTDAAPALEIYANERFDTSDGRTVIPGDVQIGDWRWRVIGAVADGVITFPAVVGIYSTEDSLDNQQATYSAYIRIRNREPIPWCENFRIPPLTQAGQVSTSWPRIRAHNAHPIARSPGNGWKQAVQAMIDAALASQQTSGTATLIGGEVEVPNTAVTEGSRIFAFSMDENVTGNLTAGIADIIEHTSFVIRSTDAGDNGHVAWFMVQ